MLQVFYLDVVYICSGYTHMLQAYVSIYFTLFQYVVANVAPHVLWLVGTHALHTSSRRCLSLSYGPAPKLDEHATQTVDHSLVKVYAHMQSARAGQHPDQHMGTRVVLPLSPSCSWTGPHTCYN
jgi:hypothetical protein